MIDDLINEALALAAESEVDKARLLASEAFRRAPDNPEALNAMGIVDTADHQHARAKTYFEKAVAASPDNASYRVNLGYAKVLEGDFDAARGDFDRALTRDPENVNALQNIVWITKLRAGDPLIDRIRDLALKADEGGEAFVKLHYMLGKCLDDIGEYDDAFAAYRRANECQPSHYDAQMHADFASLVKTVWTRARLDQLKPFGAPSPKPVFIIGMPRSGSTLVEEKLAADPRIAGLGEVPDIIKMSGALQRNHPRRAVFPLWCEDVPPSAFGGLGKFYLDKYQARHPGAERLINKSLLNFAYAGMIEAMFPHALIIETRRNAIDTCLSCYFKDLKSAHQYALRLETLGDFYRQYRGMMDHWRDTLGKLVTVQYEAFIIDAASATEALKGEMGLAVATPAIEGAPATRHVQTFSAWQVKQPIYTHAVARWKNYEKHIGPLIDALGDLAAL